MANEDMPVDKFTVQLFYHSAHDFYNGTSIKPPEPFASGVLIRRNISYYLLTCKHVFDHIKLQDVIILTKDGYSVRIPETAEFVDNENKSIDLAFIYLPVNLVFELEKSYSFLSEKHLAYDHRFDEDFFYMVYGYVNKKTSRKQKEIHSMSFGYLTTYRKFKNIEKLGFSDENNITLEYSRKQERLEDDVRQMGFRDLKGLSGCGIWLSVAGRKKNTFRYLLVGIMMEERIDRGFIIGTKIKHIEELIN